jgi:hypothetical protein
MLSTVACPKFESAFPADVDWETGSVFAEPPKLKRLAAKPLSVRVSAAGVFAVAVELSDKLFNSFSKLSNSPKSTLVLNAEDFFLSFINNSIPGPKFTEGFGEAPLKEAELPDPESPSFKLKEIGSKSLNPISITSILLLLNQVELLYLF